MSVLIDKKMGEQGVEQFVKDASGKILGVDTETNAKDLRSGEGFAQGVSIAFSYNGEYVKHYFPFRHKYGDNYDKSVLQQVKLLIEAAPRLVFHNAKFDLEALQTLDINYTGEWDCTMVIASLINENRPFAKSLEQVSRHYLGPGQHKDMSVKLKAVIDGFGWDMVPAEMMQEYAATDAELPLRLMKAMYPQMLEEVPKEVWDFKQRFINVVRTMERRGIKIDQPYCRRKYEQAQQAMDDYKDMTGGFNPQSSKDMNQLLCIDLGLPPIMSTKTRKNKETGRREKYESQTFDRKAMEQYEIWLEQSNDPRSDYILGYRGWSKAASAFYGAYLNHVSPDGRLRPSYLHHKSDDGGTVTGRLSCKNPNLQQIPRESTKPWNGGVKRSFIADSGFSLWEVDYSQLELRLATAYANEKDLIKIYNEDRDLFSEMAADMGQDRDTVKLFVYMTQYGAGIPKIASDLKISEREANDIKDTYYRNYPGFLILGNRVSAQVKQTGKCRIWSGRYRHFQYPKDEHYKGLNSLIQGGAADIVERKMVEVFEQVDQRSNGEVRMLLTVHDSVWFEIKDGTGDKWLPRIKAIMADVGSLGDFKGIKFDVESKRLG